MVEILLNFVIFGTGKLCRSRTSHCFNGINSLRGAALPSTWRKGSIEAKKKPACSWSLFRFNLKTSLLYQVAQDGMQNATVTIVIDFHAGI